MNKRYLLFQAQVIKDELSKVIGELDYTMESLSKVEDYISKTVSRAGEPDKKSFFSTDTYAKSFALGCYAGEVIRRSMPNTVWRIAEGDDSPLAVSLQNASGAVGFVINKAGKRIYHGDGDSLLHFAKVMISDMLKDDVTTTDHFDEEDMEIAKYANSELALITKGAVLGQDEIINANYSNDVWLLANNDHVSDTEEELFDYVFLDEVKDHLPALYAEMEKGKGKERIRIVKDKNGDYRYQEAHKDLFFDSSAMASFQGNMKLNPIQWIKMNSGKVLRITAYLLISLYLMIKVHWLFVLVFIPCLLYNIWYWFSTRGTFGGGNVSPGKVISINPDKIAVATDLTKMVGSYPVIKILETKLLKENKVVGKFIPTVSIYNDNPHGYPFWSQFMPVPVSHGIKDKQHMQYLMSQFSKDDFNEIDNYLAQINTQEVGTYKVNEETSGWKDYRHVDINKGINMEGPEEK